MIHVGMSMEEYRNGVLKDYISQSKLKACGAEDNVGFMNSWVGSVVHKFMEIGMENLPKVYNEFVTDYNRAQFADQRLKADRDIESKFVECQKMAESLHMDMHHVKEIEDAYHDKKSMSEVSITFDYADLKMKCRPDLISADMSVIVDWKTTSDIAEFERSVWKYLYDVQAFFYSRAVSEHSMGESPSFYFVCVDKNTYQTGVYKMSSGALLTGNERLDKLIVKYKKHLAGVRETATENGVYTINIPRWMS